MADLKWLIMNENYRGGSKVPFSFIHDVKGFAKVTLSFTKGGYSHWHELKREIDKRPIEDRANPACIESTLTQNRK